MVEEGEKLKVEIKEEHLLANDAGEKLTVRARETGRLQSAPSLAMQKSDT